MLSNEELYDLERAKNKLAEAAMRIKDDEERDKVLKCVYAVGKIIDEAESEAEAGAGQAPR